MNDNWFDDYMFEIASPTSKLSEEMRKGLETSATMLPAWDPMGSLARRGAYSAIKRDFAVRVLL